MRTSVRDPSIRYVRRFKELSPVDSKDRILKGPTFVALWASLALGAPAVLVGFRLTSLPQQGGLGLSFDQLVLIVPLGLIAGIAGLAAIAYIAAETGLPTGMLLRPGMGVAGSWIAAVVATVLYLAWAAIELQFSGVALTKVMASFGVGIDERIGILVVSLLVGVMIFVGIEKISVYFIAKIAVWAALLILIALFVSYARGEVAIGAAERGAPHPWLGMDLVFTFVVAWFPLAGDTGRFSASPESGASGISIGFGVGTAISVIVGGLGGLVLQHSVSYGSFIGSMLSGASVAVVGLVIVWIVFGESDQPFGLLYAASMSLSSAVLRRPPGLVAEALVVAAGGVGMLVSEGSLVRSIDFLVALVVPFGAILAADYYIVRRRKYLVDALYDRNGIYRGINLLGLSVYAISVLAGQWIQPSGPESWTAGVDSVIPFIGNLATDYGVPSVMSSAFLAFGLYGLIGRWRIKEEDTVSRLRF